MHVTYSREIAYCDTAATYVHGYFMNLSGLYEALLAFFSRKYSNLEKGKRAAHIDKYERPQEFQLLFLVLCQPME